MTLNVQPFPYQGSKRKTADQILEKISVKPKRIIEPFAGSAALTIAAASKQLCGNFLINDSYEPLMKLWTLIVNKPSVVINGYTELWNAQIKDPKAFYLEIRKQFNKDNDPIKLIYLMNRAVKGAIRFNSHGEFNQSADNRRLGKKPGRLMKDINTISLLLKNKAIISCADYSCVLKNLKKGDLVYMDPPYLGTSSGKDHRYHQNLNLERFIQNLEFLNERQINYMVSFDGKTGDKAYGNGLPESLGLKKINVNGGISAQGTLNGKHVYTTESLYISSGLQIYKEDESLFNIRAIN